MSINLVNGTDQSSLPYPANYLVGKFRCEFHSAAEFQEDFLSVGYFNAYNGVGRY